MKKFLKTAIGGEQAFLEEITQERLHYHVVYVDEERRFAVCAPAEDGHSHEVIWQDAVPPGSVDQAGSPIPPTPSGWFVLPEANHEHSGLEEYERDFSGEGDDASDTDKVAEVYQLFSSACDNEKESIEKARECESFYIGDQWDESLKNELQNSLRACLTINEIEPAIDELCGAQRQKRNDLRYLPQEGGDQRAADFWNIMSKYVLERCGYPREESLAFEDGAITGRGNFDLSIDFTKNIQGEIVVERLPYDRIRYGPHDKEDFSDGEYLVKTQWYSLAKAKSLWKDKADELTGNFDLAANVSASVEKAGPDQYKDMLSSGQAITEIHGEALLDITKKNICVLECWRKVYLDSKIAVNPEADCYENLLGWKDEDIKAVQQLDGFTLVPFVTPRIRITQVGCGVLLSDENPADLAVNDFHTVPFYSKKRKNRFKGKVESAMDAQREVNKRHSQAIDIGNKMAAYGWFFDSETFPNEQEKKKFKENSSTPGFTVEVNSLDRKPEKVEGVKFPSEIVQLMAISEQKVKQLMNVQVDPGGANESGAAYLHKQRTRMTGNEYLFENLSFSRRKIGQLIPPNIQKFYSVERCLRILASQQQQQDGQMPADTWTAEEVEKILKTTDIMLYDINVSESSYSPTEALATLSYLTELSRNGVQVPPTIAIELMPLPESVKRKILAMMAQSSQQEAQIEQGKQETEIKKTLIAKGHQPGPVNGAARSNAAN